MLVCLPGVVGQHLGHDLVLARREVDLGRGQMCVPEDPLHVGQCQCRVAHHAGGGAVTKVVKDPVRTKGGVYSLEHAMGAVVRQG